MRGTPEQEFAANSFAGALPLPAEVVREELGKAMGEAGGRNQPPRARDRLIWALAAVFDVTELAVAHRLIGLGMTLG